MKKIICTLAGLMLMFGIAGQAMAAFDNNGMFFVAYEENETLQTIGINDQPGKESFYDLGATSSFIGLVPGTTIDTNISLGDFNTSSWNDVWVGMFGVTSLQGYEFYFSSDDPNYTFNAVQTTGFTSGVNNLSQALTTGPNAVVDKDISTQKSYKFQMQADGDNPGFYGDPVSADTTFGAEINLAGISTTNFINLGVYGGNVFGADFIDPDGDFLGQLPLIANITLGLDATDGSLVINPSAVPIPGAVWLLGSGLLGLIGIRRRNAG